MFRKKLLIASALLIGLFWGSGLNSQPLQDGSFKVETKPYVPLVSWDQIYAGSYYYYNLPVILPFDFYYDGINCRYLTALGSGGLKLSNYSYYPYWYNYPYGYGGYKDSGYSYYAPYGYGDYADKLTRYEYNRGYGAYIYGLWGMYLSYWTWNYPNDYSMKYQVTGAPGSRVATFQWSNLCWYYVDYDYYYYFMGNPRFNFQIRLYEGTNEIEIHYGPMNRDGIDVCWGCAQWGYTNYGMIGFTKYYNGYYDQIDYTWPYAWRTTKNIGYVNIDPNGNGNMGYNNWEYGMHPSMGAELSRGWGAYETVQDNDTWDQIQQGNVIKVSYGPRIIVDKPTADISLRKDYIYGDGSTDPSGYGNDQHPQMTIDGIAGGAQVTKVIDGPISFPVHSNYKVIYNARNTFPQMTNTLFTTATPGATSNPAFGSAPSGCLDLKTNKASISGGLYRVTNSILHNAKTYENEYFFNIANDWDLEISRVLQPKSKELAMYPSTSLIPISLKYINRGLNEVNSFYSVVRIYNSENIEVYKDSVYWEAETPADRLSLAETKDLSFKAWNPLGKIGEYTFKAYAYIAGDQELNNNYWPWKTSTTQHIVKVVPEIEAEALAVISPNNTTPSGTNVDYFVGRPIQPQIRYRNNGITDISDAYTTVVIRHIGTGTEVYKKQNIVVPSINAGISFNTTDHLYDYFTPQAAGDYEITATIEAMDDEVTKNNSVTDSFKVKNAMTGTYTIGDKKNTGNPVSDSIYNARNFITLGEAINALYSVGVSGPVVFEFTKASFKEGDEDMSSNLPAIDFRAKISGVSATNTVTFKASNSLNSRGAVTINLYSNIGIGILFGQSLSVSNNNAIVNSAASSIRKVYANSDGYIIFDGGVQKTLKFILHSLTTTRLNAVFYLSQGASNISIKNCLITNSEPAYRYDDWKLPLTSESNGTYTFQLDTRSSNTESYSAGIVMRSVSPTEDFNMFNPLNNNTDRQNGVGMDTLVNKNNLIQKNEIYGFAYGVVSIGIGVLNKSGKVTKFFNNNNTISGNLIFDIGRAGIFLGFEDNSKVKGNKIYGVGKAGAYQANTDVAGILAGGEKNSTWYPYSNSNLYLDGNEISNIGTGLYSGTAASYGIKIEQGRNAYMNSTYLLPNKNENICIINNAIWGIQTSNATANRHGIRVYTMRTAPANWQSPMITDYWTYGDKIANNTIVMPNDAYNNTSGMVSGVMIQNGWNTALYNNTIAMLDNNSSGSTHYYAAVFYMGLKPSADGGLKSDNNLFWTRPAGTPTDSAALFRYIETDNSSNIITAGYRNEFLDVNQWQMTTGSDLRSLVRNFVSELTTPDINDMNSKLRVNNIPDWPVNSPMNNRGMKLNYVLFDIDGNQRGMSAQAYDIGAFEFEGDLLNSDVEVLTTSQPGAYKSSPDPLNKFSDAEYIMTKAPVEVTAELRNNGKLDQTGLDVKVQIYRQKPRSLHTDPLEFYTKPELTQNIVSAIAPGAVQTVNFGLADNNGVDFHPVPYADWRIKYQDNIDFADSLYTIEEWFSTMENNVTPLYKIVVSVRADEDIYNNVFTKVCRFYIKRSQLDMLLSVENSPYPTTTADIRAGKRNYDSLVAGFKGLGWINQWVTMEIDTYLIDYFDIFERTGWEPRAVNYTIYRTVFWSDADDKDLSMYQSADIRRFLESGKPELKKNLVISSQELVRQNWDNDQPLIEDYLGVKLDISKYYTDPLNYPVSTNFYTAGTGVPYVINDDTKWIEGIGLGRTLKQYIISTGLNDPNPVPGLMMLNPESIGLAVQAYVYNSSQVLEKVPAFKDPTMGVASTSISRNVITLGVDWRHYGSVETILRAILDYLNKNGGGIVPVELLSFNARAVSNRVEIRWETGSEFNSDKFDVERAVISDAGKSSSVRIAELDASGKSNSLKAYGPVIDKNVSLGSDYVYRLKMVDLDGSFSYSDEVLVSVGEVEGFSLSSPMPNPAANSAVVSFTLAADANVAIELYDLTGKLISVLFNGYAKAGINNATFDLMNIPAGTYSYVLRSGNSLLSKQLNIVK